MDDREQPELDSIEHPAPERTYPKFTIDAWEMGLRADLNFDKIEDVFDAIDGPDRLR
jgi:hypothetical protein